MNRMYVQRATIAACVTAAATIALAGTAHAHVTITPDEAEQGRYATLDVKVPNERDDASTVALEVHLDPDHPLASVMPQPVPGWEFDVRTTTLDKPLELHGGQVTEVPSVITWSGGEIEPGTFQQFPLSVGPLPEDAGQLVFKALQTYDSGEVVRWIEEPTDGGEPDHPAAVLHLTSGDAEADPREDAGHDAREDAREDARVNTDQDVHEPAAEASDHTATDTTARVLAAAGIAAGVAGVAFGLLGGRRRGTIDPSA